MADIYVRRATNSDRAQIHAMIKSNYKDLIGPIFKDALKRAYSIHFKAFALASCIVAYAYQVKRPMLDIALLGIMSYMFMMVLLWIYIWLQMGMEADKAIDSGLKDIEKTYSGKGSYMWVVCRGEEPEEAASGHVEGEEGKEGGAVIACVALLKEKIAGEATLQHLNTDKAEQGKQIATTLLKHVAKHAKAQGISRVVGRCSSGQRAAQHVLLKAGYKETLVTKVSTWFSVHKLVLEVR